MEIYEKSGLGKKWLSRALLDSIQVSGASYGKLKYFLNTNIEDPGESVYPYNVR